MTKFNIVLILCLLLFNSQSPNVNTCQNCKKTIIFKNGTVRHFDEVRPNRDSMTFEGIDYYPTHIEVRGYKASKIDNIIPFDTITYKLR